MFRWLEVLEKEFDKAFVDVDLLLGEIDPDQADITYEGRQKMTSLSSCFAQLCHKAQTVSQINHKLEVRGAAEAPRGSGGRWGRGGLLPSGSRCSGDASAAGSRGKAGGGGRRGRALAAAAARAVPPRRALRLPGAVLEAAGKG